MNKVLNLACKLYYFMGAAGLNTQKFSSTGSSGISFLEPACIIAESIF